jgi:hypothetical protein
MTATANETSSRRFSDEAWHRGNLDVADERDDGAEVYAGARS